MSIKRRHKTEASFSMASMTDVIFLLLIFFMITSTIVFPNSIKVNLPQSKQQTGAKPLSRVTIDKQNRYFVAFGNEAAHQVSYEELEQFLSETQSREPDLFVALYADESVPYGEIVKILNIANDYQLRMVLATRPPKK